MRHLQPDDIIQGSMFAESVEPYGTGKNTRILATLEDGSAGIVTSTFGKGHTMYVGSFLALANSRGSLWDQSTQRLTVQDEANKNTNQFLMGLVDWAGIERPFTASQSGNADNPLVIRLHENQEGYLMYVLNHGKTTEKATIRLNVKSRGTYLLEEITQKKSLRVTSQGQVVEFTTGDIAEKGAEVWTIRFTFIP